MTLTDATPSAFVPDSEVHRIRQEIQIAEMKFHMAQVELERLDSEYHAAIEAAEPSQIYSPELIAAPTAAFDLVV